LLPRVAALRDLAPAPRLAALTAIVDELVFADDPQRSDAMNALRAHAANGLFYSPSATEPSMLWFQYERACRRSEVRRKGATPQALEQTLGALRERRAGALPMIGALRKGQATELYDLTSFGWHGAGEVLEAVADLAEQKGEAARDVGAELAKYLACEKPHPLQPHLEAGAGLGEAVPAATEASRFPVLWGDGYRIALARAVLATKPAGVDATHAVLHLLYSPRRADRFDAIARLRGAALGADAVTHLVAQLGDADRLVVREVIALLGSGGEAARAARERLRELANGTDKELRATAERALKQLDR
jgi:hypothetical protein